MMNCCLVQDRPACVMRVAICCFCAFLARSSISRSELSTCSRRERWLRSTRRATGSVRVKEARRFSACFSPDSSG